MSQPQDEGAPASPRGDWRGALIIVLAALALVHSLLLGLWLAPSGPVREAAGSERLATYVDPYFRQAWDVLEPSAQRVDETLRVRARVRVSADEVVETPWVDATSAELRATRGDVNPARAHVAARRLATNLNRAMFELGTPGRKVVLESYVAEPQKLQTELLATDAPPLAVLTYLNADAMATRFASLYTQAVADERVVQVQFRVGRRTVPARSRDEAESLADVPWDWFEFGWRRAVRGTAPAQAAFDSLVGETR